MEDFFNNPEVQLVLQGGVVPFVVAFIVMLLLQSVRLGGLAVVAAFCTVVYFFAAFSFTPLTATRKIILLGIASPIVGILADFAFKPTRIGGAALALAGAAATMWVFWPVFWQKQTADVWMFGGAAAVAVAFMIWFGQVYLAGHAVRAGAGGL